MKTIDLTEIADKDVPHIQSLIKNARGPKTVYEGALEQYGGGTRNTAAQISYLSAFEKALCVFRAASVELRKEMDVLSLEQRLAAMQPKEPLSPEEKALQQTIAEAVFLSNRYALAVAGHAGLALLDAEPAAIESIFSFGPRMDTSQDRDALAGALASCAALDILRIAKSKTGEGDEPLKHTFEAIFTSWTRQFRWQTHKDAAEKHRLQDLSLKYGTLTMQAGEAKRRFDTVVVDERLMRVTKEEVIGGGELGARVWSNLVKLAAYDPARKKNPYNPASVIFTYGEPGGGKTLTAHAYLQSFAQLCREKNIPLWAFTHSTTDYASHYQNKTANELSALAGKVREFPGPVVMYVADADNIFKSRKDPRLTAEQQQTMSVYFKMFDGSFIPKCGKFMAIMDANTLEGIDDATKSRIFDEIVECRRFEKAEHFAELARRCITSGVEGVGLSDADWLAIGEQLLKGPLSNREISHVVGRLRRGFDVPETMLGRQFDEHVAYRNERLKGIITKENVLKEIDSYIATRMEIERNAMSAMYEDNRVRFLEYLGKKNEGTQAQ